MTIIKEMISKPHIYTIVYILTASNHVLHTALKFNKDWT